MAGLIGALLHTKFGSVVLNYILGSLVGAAGLMGIPGVSKKLRFTGASAWIAGALSGIFGGLVGNQGGIRSGAMLGMGVVIGTLAGARVLRKIPEPVFLRLVAVIILLLGISMLLHSGKG